MAATRELLLTWLRQIRPNELLSSGDLVQVLPVCSLAVVGEGAQDVGERLVFLLDLLHIGGAG